MQERLMSWSHLRQFDERAIRYFTVVCEEQSVRAAAERLRIAPSAIGRKLKELETDLGIALLNRTAKGIAPTALGAVFLDYLAKRHLQDAEIISRLLELTRLKHGEIRIALGEAFLLDFVTSATARFRTIYPGIRFVIQVMNTEQIMQSLENNVTDIGIAFNPPDAQSAVAAFERKSHFACVLPRAWVFAPAEPVTLADLQTHPCALLSRDFSARRLIDAAERAAGVRLEIVLETNSLYALKHFIGAGLGLTLLPDFAMMPEIAAGQARQVRVADPVLNDIPVKVFISNLGKDHPTTLELLHVMGLHMALLSDGSDVTVLWPRPES